MTAPLTGSWAGQSPTATNLDGTTHGSGTTSERNAGTGADFADRPFFDTDLKAWYHYDTEWKKHAAIVTVSSPVLLTALTTIVYKNGTVV